MEWFRLWRRFVVWLRSLVMKLVRRKKVDVPQTIKDLAEIVEDGLDQGGAQTSKDSSKPVQPEASEQKPSNVYGMLTKDEPEPVKQPTSTEVLRQRRRQDREDRIRKRRGR